MRKLWLREQLAQTHTLRMGQIKLWDRVLHGRECQRSLTSDSIMAHRYACPGTHGVVEKERMNDTILQSFIRKSGFPGWLWHNTVIHLLHLLTQHGLWVMHHCPPPYISTMPKTGQVFFVRADFAQTDLDSGPAAGVVSASPLQGPLTILIQGKGSRVAFKAIVSHLHLCVRKCYSLSWKRS